MRVHARALHAGERLGHERGVDSRGGGELAHEVAERHHAVGHRQRVGVAQIDLLLARGVLVERVLDGDPHRLERADRALAQLAGDVVGGEVEEPGGVDRAGAGDVVTLAGAGQLVEVEELDVRRDVEREALLVGGAHGASQHLARVAHERLAVELMDVAEDPRLDGGGVAPGSARTCWHRDGQHVGLLPREAVDRRTVECHAVDERVVEFGRRDREALQSTEDVGEPHRTSRTRDLRRCA